MTDAAGIIGVCGAGAMGSGIAQIAAQHGATVKLFDLSADALSTAGARIAKSLDGLAAKGKLDPETAAATKDRVIAVTDLAELSDCNLVIEAIVEDAAVKGNLFEKLEAVLQPHAVIATNTSSLPIARLARPLRDPARFVGMHFFNPPTSMKLVEVIAGPATDQAVCDAVQRTARSWGKVAVRVADVPGFIVNRVARPFYAEAFAALQEHAAEPCDIDALFRRVGFRMGPLELTDFIGQDINFTVARSVYAAYFGRTRFTPQLGQSALVDAGWFGRKTGRGVYDYRDGSAVRDPDIADDIDPVPDSIRAAADLVKAALPGEVVHCDGIDLAITLGSTARTLAAASGRPTALFDWFDGTGQGLVGYTSTSEAAELVARQVAVVLGSRAIRIEDRPGLIVMRTLAQIANAAADAVFENVADEDGVDSALRFGANYPIGPFAWSDRYGRSNVRAALTAIAHETGDPMYNPSQYLADW